MEETTMSLVDWIYIIGGLVLLVVLIDGLRRMNSNWKHKVRLKVGPDDEHDEELEGRDGVALLRGELPNGGARVVRAEPFISSEEPQFEPKLAEVEEQSATIAESNTDESNVVESVDSTTDSTTDSNTDESNAISPSSQEQSTTIDLPVEDLQPISEDLEQAKSSIEKVQRETKNKPAKIKEKTSSKIKSAVQKQLVFSDALFATDNDQPPKKAAKPNKPEEIKDIIVIHIQIPSSETIDSQLLVPLLQDNGMRHGEMGIFHRQDDRNIASTPLFSLANSQEPGTFDLDAKEGFAVAGLTLFFTLPGPEDPVVALDEMIKLAEILKTELRADWLDSGRNPLNIQILEHLRQKVRDFKLQHPA